MKFTKIEKIWLTAVVIFYVLYNLPLVPVYHSASGTIIHGLCTLIPLWISVYWGLIKVSRFYSQNHSQTSTPEEVEEN